MDVHFACVCGHYFRAQVEPWDVNSVYQWLIYYYHSISKTPLITNNNKRYKALHPGKVIDQKKVSSRPSARPDMRRRVATVLGNLLRQQLWVIVTSKFGPLAPNPNRAYAEFIRSPPRLIPNWCWYYAMRLYAGGCPYFLPHPHPLANGAFMFILTLIQ